MAAPDEVVRLDEKFDGIGEHWSPKVVAQINDMHVKAVKVQGSFVWHVHEDTDELFLVQSGSVTIQMKERPDVVLGPNEIFVVPRGVEHRPIADEESEVLVLEPAGVVNTGDSSTGSLTAPTDNWA
ncbi:MAG: cupin domain-containing protein [Acidimicrobiia bacterium]